MSEVAKQRWRSCEKNAMTWSSWTGICREWAESKPVVPFGIIMLTVRKTELEKIEALDAGADDYITKPFSMPELLARLRANLRRSPLSPRQGSSVITFGEVQVDLGSHHVTISGRDLR